VTVERLKAEVSRESHEDKRELGLEYARLWSLTDYIPLSERRKTYFLMERWPPKPHTTEFTPEANRVGPTRYYWLHEP